jgi:hypothetical protein
MAVPRTVGIAERRRSSRVGIRSQARQDLRAWHVRSEHRAHFREREQPDRDGDEADAFREPRIAERESVGAAGHVRAHCPDQDAQRRHRAGLHQRLVGQHRYTDQRENHGHRVFRRLEREGDPRQRRGQERDDDDAGASGEMRRQRRDRERRASTSPCAIEPSKQITTADGSPGM